MGDAERLGGVPQLAEKTAAVGQLLRRDGGTDRHQRMTRRLELFSALRNVAEGEEPPFIISPIQLYEHEKIIPRAEVIRQTTTLGGFLQAEGIVLDTKKYHDLYTTLSEKVPGAIITFEAINVRAPKLYRVYPPILALQRELVTSLAQEVKDAATPPIRTADEARTYQEERLLRRKNSQGELVPIAFEEALSELLSKTKRFAEELQGREDIYDIASIVCLRLLPYIQGRTGDFDNFHRFMRYALVSVRHELYEQRRRQKRQQKAYREAWREEKTPAAGAGGKPAYDFAALPKEETMVLRLHARGIPNRSIAQILDKTPGSIKHLLMRAKDRINPARQKKEAAPQTFDPNTAVAAYEVFRKALGRVPTTSDLQLAYQTGALPYSAMAYRYHFGNGKVRLMKENLERMRRVRGFNKTKEFRKEAIAEGGYDKKPPKITWMIWSQAIDILTLYLETNSTEKEIAAGYGISDEMVRVIIKNYVKTLWSNASAQTQARFPLSELLLRKPQNTQVQERPVFQRKNGWVETQLKRARKDVEIQEAMAHVTRGMLVNLRRKHLVLPMRNVVIEAGYTARPGDLGFFLQVLKDAGITVRDIPRKTEGKGETNRYLLIHCGQRQRAVRALQENHELAHLRRGEPKQVFP